MEYKINRGAEGSPYWGFQDNFPGRQEDYLANPDVLSNEEVKYPWSPKSEVDEELLHGYYRAIACGALKKLTKEELTIWKLTFFEKLTLTQAAKLTLTSISTVRRRLRTAGMKIQASVLRGNQNLAYKTRKSFHPKTK